MVKRTLRVASIVLLLALCSAAPASAQYVGGNSPNAGSNSGPGHNVSALVPNAESVGISHVGSHHNSHVGSHHNVDGSAGVSGRGRAGGLALTGADLLQLALIAALCTGIGVAARRGARRRPAST